MERYCDVEVSHQAKLSDDDRRLLRQQESAPLLERLRGWLDEQAVNALPKLKSGDAVQYARNQWSALVNYVEDGRRPIDNNDTERDQATGEGRPPGRAQQEAGKG